MINSIISRSNKLPSRAGWKQGLRLKQRIRAEGTHVSVTGWNQEPLRIWGSVFNKLHFVKNQKYSEKIAEMNSFFSLTWTRNGSNHPGLPVHVPFLQRTANGSSPQSSGRSTRFRPRQWKRSASNSWLRRRSCWIVCHQTKMLQFFNSFVKKARTLVKKQVFGRNSRGVSKRFPTPGERRGYRSTPRPRESNPQREMPHFHRTPRGEHSPQTFLHSTWSRYWKKCWVSEVVRKNEKQMGKEKNTP